jgi:hypothetical protein
MILVRPSEVSVSSGQLAYFQKRRSTRIYNAIPLSVKGSDAFRGPYLEQVSTLTVNCHGCRYRSNYEVVQGDIVYLEVRQSRASRAAYSCQAQVKSVQRLVTMDSRFEIAVELGAPGNIWGIVSPPSDWFPIPMPDTAERENIRQDQSLATRGEQRPIPILSEASTHLSDLGREDPITAPTPSIGQLMAGFDTQIQTLAFQMATAAFANERERLVGEFRTQLENETIRTLECAISNSREELMRRVVEELQTAHEAAARITYEQWKKKIEHDTKTAAQAIRSQAVEVSRRVEGMTISTIEGLQRTMEASRNEASDRFLSRLREQLAPLLDDAQVSLQNLRASENKLRDESQAIRERFKNFLRRTTQNCIAEVQEKTLGMLDQFDSDVTRRLEECHNELNETAVTIISDTSRILSELPQSCEESVQGQLRLLVSSAAVEVTSVLKEHRPDFSSIIGPTRS